MIFARSFCYFLQQWQKVERQIMIHILNTKKYFSKFLQNKKMLGKGLEPSSHRHTNLNRTCIPVPSPQQLMRITTRFNHKERETTQNYLSKINVASSSSGTLPDFTS